MSDNYVIGEVKSALHYAACGIGLGLGRGWVYTIALDEEQ
jgi:hypothetical protein